MRSYTPWGLRSVRGIRARLPASFSAGGTCGTLPHAQDSASHIEAPRYQASLRPVESRQDVMRPAGDVDDPRRGTSGGGWYRNLSTTHYHLMFGGPLSQQWHLQPDDELTWTNAVVARGVSSPSSPASWVPRPQTLVAPCWSRRRTSEVVAPAAASTTSTFSSPVSGSEAAAHHLVQPRL